MARERMVTRTVVVTTVKVMCVNIATCAVEVKTFELSGMIETKEQALKVVKKLYENELIKCVDVQEMYENEILYGMSEIDFIQNAKVLPPRGTKAEEE